MSRRGWYPPGTRPIRRRLMDGPSETRPSPASTTLANVADHAFCAQAAALLGCGQGPIRDSFIGGPAEEVLEMWRWPFSHQAESWFAAARLLTAWAKRCGLAGWSGRGPSPAVQGLNGKLAVALIRFWSENPC